MIDTCERCKKRRGSLLALAGEYQAILCPSCCNEWTIFIMRHDVFAKYDGLQPEYDMLLARSYHDGADRLRELRDVRASQRAFKTLLFAIAIGWVGGLSRSPIREEPDASDEPAP